MVVITRLLRVFLPFEVHIGWRTIENFLFSSWECARATVPTATNVNTAYQAPKVKFMKEPRKSEVAPSLEESSSAEGPEEMSDSEIALKSRIDASRASPIERRRTRSIGIPVEADYSSVTVGDPETLFSDMASFSIEDTGSLVLRRVLREEKYQREIRALKQKVEDLTQELGDARDILDATEMQVEEVLTRNIKLERSVKTLNFENAQLCIQNDQYLHDITTLHEWIYSVQGPLTQLGIYPSTLNDKLTVKMKKSPRPFPTLSPEVSSRLATSTDYFTPPSSPPPKLLGPKPEKGSLSIKPPCPPSSSGSSSGRSSPDWDGESVMRPFAASSPVACSSPARTRSPSPFSLSDHAD